MLKFIQIWIEEIQNMDAGEVIENILNIGSHENQVYTFIGPVPTFIFISII